MNASHYPTKEFTGDMREHMDGRRRRFNELKRRAAETRKCAAPLTPRSAKPNENSQKREKAAVD